MKCKENKYKFLQVAWLTFALFQISIISALAQNSAKTVELNYDFHHGLLGWTADFSDYPAGQEEFYELFAGIRYMPRKLTRVPRRGFYIQGNNHSDDLFMFLKRRLGPEDGIVANRAYQVQFVLTFASNAPSGCFGAGGAPGESVHLKAGASPIEPLSVLYPDGWRYMNVDKGNQGNGGAAASVAGNIANGIPCEQAIPFSPFAFVQRSHQHTTTVTANPNGELWLLVGTDSGFEAITRLYYQNIWVRLVSAN